MESIENIDFIYCIINKISDLYLRLDENIITFEDKKSAEQFIETIPGIFKKDSKIV